MAQDNTFYRKLNLSGMHGGLQLEATSDGGFIATGQHEGNGSAGGCDIYVYRVDPCGNNLWYKLYGTPGTEGGKSIKQTADGGFIITGHYGNNQGFLLKIDGKGNVEWAKTYSGTNWIMYAEETANGDFVCIGHANNLSVFRTNKRGDVLWARAIPNIGNMCFYISELPNGDFIFPSSNGLPGKDVAITRIRSNGDIVYSRLIGGNGWRKDDHTEWSCKGLLDANKEYLYVTSPTQVGGSENIFILKWRISDASVVWAKSLGGPASDQSREITLCPQGIAIIGNSNSYPANAGSGQGITHDMHERDILLTKLDNDGNLIWTRTYGGNARDRGIGVKYNFNDNSFNISAFSNSAFFEATSFDPVFIKTDSLGKVNCQMYSPSLSSLSVNPAFAPGANTSNPFSIQPEAISPVINKFIPDDKYVCKNCSTEPLFIPSDTIVCINEPVYLMNKTKVGLTCFQEWRIDGKQYNGGLDTIEYRFTKPGDYQVELFSNCGGVNNKFISTIHVYDVAINNPVLSDFNGVNISCHGFSDGYIKSSATGGYLPSGSSYSWSVNPGNHNIPDPSKLSAGDYIITASDKAGCADTFKISLTEPTALKNDSFLLADYNNFQISCFDGNDGKISVFPEGGIAPYSFIWSNGSANQSTAQGLSQGVYTLTVIDKNGCTVKNTYLLNAPPKLITDLLSFSDTCYRRQGHAHAISSGGVQPYSYKWNNVAGNDHIYGLIGGSHTMNIIDKNNCIMSRQFTIDNLDGPVANMKIIPESECSFSKAMFKDASLNNPVYWQWNIEGIGESQNPIERFFFPEAGDYSVNLMVKNEYDCKDDTTIIYTVKWPDIRMFSPNTFTPNDDGLNDVFKPLISGHLSYKMTVYNRWGEVVYTGVESDAGWYGDHNGNGKTCQNDMYYYTIFAKGSCENLILKGTILLCE